MPGAIWRLPPIYPSPDSLHPHSICRIRAENCTSLPIIPANGWCLYFYPKDDTPGCTKEACSFRDDLQQLEKLGAKVVGISEDDADSHARFAQKYHLPFPLLADKDGSVADSYGALTNLGLVKFAKRYTFLIDPQGKIAKVYEKVDTSRHSQEIILDLQHLKAA